jgi:hypothetical protein
MPTVKKGKQTVESKVDNAVAAEGQDPKNMSIEELFNYVEAQGTRTRGNAAVSAETIRGYIDQLFESGKDKVPVALLVHTINTKHELTSKTGVQNASVRSAAIAGGKYKIETVDGQAIIVKV